MFYTYIQFLMVKMYFFFKNRKGVCTVKQPYSHITFPAIYLAMCQRLVCDHLPKEKEWYDLQPSLLLQLENW